MRIMRRESYGLSPESMELAVAVCTENLMEYMTIERAVMAYAKEKQGTAAVQWFRTREDYLQEHARRQFPITFLAFEDIVNQELAVLARSIWQESQIVWVGEDQRFGVSSYRIGVANFLMKPVDGEAVWDSLDRCFMRLEEAGSL